MGTTTEQTQKQLLLVAGVISSAGGIVSALGGIAGNFTDFYGKIDALNKLPPWVFWVVSGTLFLFGLWLLIKWRTRHSRLLKPDALRLDRDNSEHLVGRAQDIDNLLQQCLLKQVVFLEGESGSGKSALVRSGLLPQMKSEKSILPLVLPDLWVDHWERGPFQALRIAMMNSSEFADEAANSSESETPSTPLSTLADIEQRLTKLSDTGACTALVIFDQFDDYQARNRDRFLPNKTWLSPEALRKENPFWEMIAQLLEKEKIRGLFVARSDTAAGLNSVQFLGAVQALRLDRVKSPYISELLTRLTEGKPEAPIIADPDAGWNKLRERIIEDISQQDVVLPQQLKIMLGGIQSLKQLNIAQYERAGGASGIEALYVEQQITGTSRKVGLEAGRVRAILVALIDPTNPTKTRSCSKQELAAIPIAGDKLDAALQELERGEMLRSASDPESGLIAYRLDHDYLARGVLAAERRANRWQYLLSDGARGFEKAGSLATRWKALLPIATQFQLGWQRILGKFHYGSQRGYALVSLCRFVPFTVLILSLGFGGWEFSRWRDDQAANEVARNIWLKFDFRSGVSEREIEGAWALASTKNIDVRTDFARDALVTKEYAERLIIRPDLVVQSLVGINPGIRARIVEALSGHIMSDAYDAKAIAAVTIATRLNAADLLRYRPILSAIKLTKDPDALGSLSAALVMVGKRLKPEEAYAVSGLIFDAISGTKIQDQINALIPALLGLASQLREEDAYAIARLIFEAKKANNQTPELSSVFTTLASRLKPDDAKVMGFAILEMMREPKASGHGIALAKWLANIGPRLKPQDAMALERQILEISKDAGFSSRRWPLTQVFIATAPQVAAADSESLLRSLIELIKGKTDTVWRRNLGLLIAPIISRLKPEDAKTYANQILEQIKRTKNPEQRGAWGTAFASIASYLRPEEVAPIAKLLLDAPSDGIVDNLTIDQSDEADQIFTLRRRMMLAVRARSGESAFSNDAVAMAPLLRPEDALVLGRRTIDQIFSDGYYYSDIDLNQRVLALVALAPKLTPEGSYELATKMVDNLPKLSPRTKGPFTNEMLKALTEIVRNIKRTDAYFLARSLVDDIKDAKSSVQVRILAVIARQLSPVDLQTIAGLVTEVAKGAKSGRQLVALAPALTAMTSQLKVEDTQAFLDLLIEEVAQSVDDDLSEAARTILSLLARQPWPERLKRIAALLKYPTIYGEGRDVLLDAIKEHPGANAIQSPGDVWAVVEWLKAQPGIDITSPPQRMKTATH